MEYLKIKNGKFKQITKRACLITLESGEEAIFPLSQVVVFDNGLITVAEWLAKKKFKGIEGDTINIIREQEESTDIELHEPETKEPASNNDIDELRI